MSFDKLAFAKRLEGSDTFSRPQAEALTEAFDHAIHETVATKQDVAAVANDVRTVEASVRTLEGSIRGELASLGSELRSEMRASMAESRLWTVFVIGSVLRRSKALSGQDAFC